MQEVIQQVDSALKIVDCAVEGFNRTRSLISSPVLRVEDLNFFCKKLWVRSAWFTLYLCFVLSLTAYAMPILGQGNKGVTEVGLQL